jgi:hypothetical protein
MTDLISGRNLEDVQFIGAVEDSPRCIRIQKVGLERSYTTKKQNSFG